MRRVEDISNQIKTNYHFIDDTRDKVKYLTSLMDIRVNIPEEIEKQFGKMKKEIVVKKCIKSTMTKEELRSKILELEKAMREQDSKSTTAKLSDEWDELMSKLEDVIYDELEGVAVKIVTERIVDKYDVDTDILIAEYMESGDLEESFKIAAEECDCGWKTDITKRILK